MKAKITKINKPRISRNQDVYFQRIHLQLENGDHAMTDLVSNFRNFVNWKEVIESGPGTVVDGVELLEPKKVNGDSQVKIIKYPLPLGAPEPGQLEIDAFQVRSHSDPKQLYKIVKTPAGWECTCPGYLYRKTCKHLEEAMINK